jgi:3D (Asp-Asp-Asp) domain-containing protein
MPISLKGLKPKHCDMKELSVAILLAAMASPAGAAFIGRKPESMLARVTVYWASGGRGSDWYTRRHKCSTGLRLRDGHCAVDPQRIPYGSNIILPDGTSLAAVDTGTAVRNRKAARLLGRSVTEKNALVIDRFFETKGQALAWANSHPHFIPVRVVPPGRMESTARGNRKPPPLLAAASPASTGSLHNVAGARGSLPLPKIH